MSDSDPKEQLEGLKQKSATKTYSNVDDIILIYT